MIRCFLCLVAAMSIQEFCFSHDFLIREEIINDKQSLDHRQILIFEDTTASLTFSDIFNPASEEIIFSNSWELPFRASSNIWMKVSIKNETNRYRDLIVFFNDWDATIWQLLNNDTTFVGQKGILVGPTRSEQYLGEQIGSKILLSLAPESTVTYYVKTHGFFDHYGYSVAVQDQKSISRQINRDLWAIGTFTGYFLFILLATFFLFYKALQWRGIFYIAYCIAGFLFFGGYYSLDYFVGIIWPISYVIFLPLSGLFYLLFVYHFLKLNTHKWANLVFSTYISLLSIVLAFLIYAYFLDQQAFYHTLKVVNRVNIVFTILSLTLVWQVKGKRKFYILAGVFFLFLGGGTYTLVKTIFPDSHSFIYPMMGFMAEMTAFLVGNFFVRNSEHQRSIRELHEKEKELVSKKGELLRFTSLIREKNKLIEDLKTELRSKETEEQYLPSDSNISKAIDHLMQSTILTRDEWSEFKKLFSRVYPGFLANLRLKYPDLTETEERFIALTKLQLSSREISYMLGISMDSVYKSRYRLSKKLNITSENLESIITTLG